MFVYLKIVQIRIRLIHYGRNIGQQYKIVRIQSECRYLCIDYGEPYRRESEAGSECNMR